MSIKSKKLVLVGSVVAALALTLACSACSGENGATSGEAATTASADSLVAAHTAINQDISSLTEVSYLACGACHGDYTEIRDKTKDMWAGVGQITAANPHEAHATNALVCSDCHSLAGTSVNQCNGCHIFETPAGWVDKDSKTTSYGITNDEPTY